MCSALEMNISITESHQVGVEQPQSRPTKQQVLQTHVRHPQQGRSGAPSLPPPQKKPRWRFGHESGLSPGGQRTDGLWTRQMWHKHGRGRNISCRVPWSVWCHCRQCQEVDFDLCTETCRYWLWGCCATSVPWLPALDMRSRAKNAFITWPRAPGGRSNNLGWPTTTATLRISACSGTWWMGWHSCHLTRSMMACSTGGGLARLFRQDLCVWDLPETLGCWWRCWCTSSVFGTRVPPMYPPAVYVERYTPHAMVELLPRRHYFCQDRGVRSVVERMKQQVLQPGWTPSSIHLEGHPCSGSGRRTPPSRPYAGAGPHWPCRHQRNVPS